MSLAALIQAIYPAIVAVLSLRFGHMASGPRPWVALVMAIGGVALVIGGFQVGGSAMGIVLAVLSPLIYAFVMVFSAQIAGERRGATAASRTGGGPDTDSAVAAAVMLSAATAALFPVSVVLGRPVGPTGIPTDRVAEPARPWLVTGGLGMQAMYAATARIGAAQTALVDTLEPVSAVILAAIFLGEQLGARADAGRRDRAGRGGARPDCAPRRTPGANSCRGFRRIRPSPTAIAEVSWRPSVPQCPKEEGDGTGCTPGSHAGDPE